MNTFFIVKIYRSCIRKLHRIFIIISISNLLNLSPIPTRHIAQNTDFEEKNGQEFDNDPYYEKEDHFENGNSDDQITEDDSDKIEEKPIINKVFTSKNAIEFKKKLHLFNNKLLDIKNPKSILSIINKTYEKVNLKESDKLNEDFTLGYTQDYIKNMIKEARDLKKEAYQLINSSVEEFDDFSRFYLTFQYTQKVYLAVEAVQAIFWDDQLTLDGQNHDLESLKIIIKKDLVANSFDFISNIVLADLRGQANQSQEENKLTSEDIADFELIFTHLENLSTKYEDPTLRSKKALDNFFYLTLTAVNDEDFAISSSPLGKLMRSANATLLIKSSPHHYLRGAKLKTINKMILSLISKNRFINFRSEQVIPKSCQKKSGADLPNALELEIADKDQVESEMLRILHHYGLLMGGQDFSDFYLEYENALPSKSMLTSNLAFNNVFNAQKMVETIMPKDKSIFDYFKNSGAIYPQFDDILDFTSVLMIKQEKLFLEPTDIRIRKNVNGVENFIISSFKNLLTSKSKNVESVDEYGFDFVLNGIDKPIKASISKKIKCPKGQVLDWLANRCTSKNKFKTKIEQFSEDDLEYKKIMGNLLDFSGQEDKAEFETDYLNKYLINKMIKQKKYYLDDLISKKIKKKTKRIIDLRFPSLFSSDYWRRFAYRELAIFFKEHLNTKNKKTLTRIKQVCSLTQGNPPICENNTKASDIIKDAEQELRIFLTEYRYLPKINFYSPTFADNFHFYKSAWNSLQRGKSLPNSKISEWDFLMNSIESGNPWAVLRVSYLLILDDIKDGKISSNIGTRIVKALKELKLDYVLIPFHINRVLDRKEKIILAEQILTRENQNNVNLFSTKSEKYEKNFYEVFYEVNNKTLLSEKQINNAFFKYSATEDDVDNSLFEDDISNLLSSELFQFSNQLYDLYLHQDNLEYLKEKSIDLIKNKEIQSYQDIKYLFLRIDNSAKTSIFLNLIKQSASNSKIELIDALDKICSINPKMDDRDKFSELYYMTKTTQQDLAKDRNNPIQPPPLLEEKVNWWTDADWMAFKYGMLSGALYMGAILTAAVTGPALIIGTLVMGALGTQIWTANVEYKQYNRAQKQGRNIEKLAKLGFTENEGAREIERSFAWTIMETAFIFPMVNFAVKGSNIMARTLLKKVTVKDAIKQSEIGFSQYLLRQTDLSLKNIIKNPRKFFTDIGKMLTNEVIVTQKPTEITRSFAETLSQYYKGSHGEFSKFLQSHIERSKKASKALKILNKNRKVVTKRALEIEEAKRSKPFTINKTVQEKSVKELSADDRLAEISRITFFNKSKEATTKDLKRLMEIEKIEKIDSYKIKKKGFLGEKVEIKWAGDIYDSPSRIQRIRKWGQNIPKFAYNAAVKRRKNIINFDRIAEMKKLDRSLQKHAGDGKSLEDFIFDHADVISKTVMDISFLKREIPNMIFSQGSIPLRGTIPGFSTFQKFFSELTYLKRTISARNNLIFESMLESARKELGIAPGVKVHDKSYELYSAFDSTLEEIIKRSTKEQQQILLKQQNQTRTKLARTIRKHFNKNKLNIGNQEVGKMDINKLKRLLFNPSNEEIAIADQIWNVVPAEKLYSIPEVTETAAAVLKALSKFKSKGDLRLFYRKFNALKVLNIKNMTELYGII